MADHGWIAPDAGTATETAERTADATTRDTETADGAPRDTETTEYAARFPGCRPVRLLTDRLTDFEGRLEYWDARTETAWVVAEPTGGIHEGTSRRLIHLAERIALVRGTPIASFGSVDLLVRDAGGAPERMMQADETLYLHPGRARLPKDRWSSASTTCRTWCWRWTTRRMSAPASCRSTSRGDFPSCGSWCRRPASAAGARRAVTIHQLESGRYRSAAASRAFPGWTATEIHTALTEPATTAHTWRALERVGRTLGAREGTGPDDTPLLRSLGEQARAEGTGRGVGRDRAQHASGARDSSLRPVSGRIGRARRCSARRADDRGARVRGRAGLPTPRRVAALTAVTPVRCRCG